MDDDFFAIQVAEGLEDDRAVLIVGNGQVSFRFEHILELERDGSSLNRLRIPKSEGF